jgi:hypothetical protein
MNRHPYGNLLDHLTDGQINGVIDSYEETLSLYREEKERRATAAREKRNKAVIDLYMNLLDVCDDVLPDDVFLTDGQRDALTTIAEDLVP